MTFDIALTGLNAASVELEVISNNIANNSTTGFKRSRTEFSDVYASSQQAANNPATGKGVRVSAVRQNFEQGDTVFTTRNLDLTIEGQGLFRLNSEGTISYTRAGNFSLDREGFIVSSSGAKLTGFSTNDDDEIQSLQSPIQIDYSDVQPNPTTSIELGMNLHINDEVLPPFDVNDASTFNFSTSTTIFDSSGTAQIATVYLHKDTPNSWSSFVYVGGNEVSQPGGDQLDFDTSGILQSINGTPGGTFTTNTFSPNPGVAPMTLDFDVSGTTQFDSPFGVNRVSQDGFTAGQLEDFDIDPDGIIFGRYTNGQAKIMGQVTLTGFANMNGLKQIGDTQWAETFASGDPITGVPNSASLGALQSGALEGSNVDITKELVAMISSQRSFQANAQVISTGDTLTQTIINIRR